MRIPQYLCGAALVAHLYTYAPPRYRTSQYHMASTPSQYLCGTILVTLYLMVRDKCVL